MLNETRDKLRETNYKILDIEDGILQLKEDLIQERAEARIEKKRLKKAVVSSNANSPSHLKDIDNEQTEEFDTFYLGETFLFYICFSDLQPLFFQI